MSTTYDDDYIIITSNVFLWLCRLKEEWHDVRSVAKKVGCYNSFDVAYLAETILLKMQYIEHDPRTHNVRLTSLGKQNCGNWVKIPPWIIQRLSNRLGM